MNIPSMAWIVPNKSPSLFDARPNMVWNARLSEFVLNMLCKLVDKGLNLRRGFKESYLKSVCNDVQDFTGIIVTPSQMYNQMRKWKAKWITVWKLKFFPGVTFDSARCVILMDKEVFKHHLMVSFAYLFFVEDVQTVMVD
jgi:hypothetical protein